MGVNPEPSLPRKPMAGKGSLLKGQESSLSVLSSRPMFRARGRGPNQPVPGRGFQRPHHVRGEEDQSVTRRFLRSSIETPIHRVVRTKIHRRPRTGEVDKIKQARDGRNNNGSTLGTPLVRPLDGQGRSGPDRAELAGGDKIGGRKMRCRRRPGRRPKMRNGWRLWRLCWLAGAS